jgi:hypothetical protein
MLRSCFYVMVTCQVRKVCIQLLLWISPIRYGVQATAQLVEALRYKLEDQGFNSRCLHWHNPSCRTMALGSTQPVAEKSTRYIYWEVKAAATEDWQLSCVDFLEVCEPEPPGTLRASNRPVQGLLYLRCDMWIYFLLFCGRPAYRFQCYYLIKKMFKYRSRHSTVY